MENLDSFLPYERREQPLKGYKSLIIESTKERSGYVHFSFENSQFSFSMHKKTLQEKFGINPEELKSGIRLLVKGEFAGDKVVDIILAKDETDYQI